MHVLVVLPRDCPNCGTPPGSKGSDYNCPNPECGEGFCSHCFKSMPEGDGSYMRCPKCNAVLDFLPYEEMKKRSKETQGSGSQN